MKTKKCIDCCQIKPHDEFYKAAHHKDGLMSYCGKCFNKRVGKRWVNLKIEMVNHMGGKCKRCNLALEDSHYSVFDFHHLNPEEKDVSWRKLRMRSKSKIHEELSKCVVLCSNCHRLVHALNIDMSKNN